MQLCNDLFRFAESTFEVTEQAVQLSRFDRLKKLPAAMIQGKDLTDCAAQGSSLYNAVVALLPLVKGFDQIAQIVSEVGILLFVILVQG